MDRKVIDVSSYSSLFPHIFVWGSCFWFCIPPSASRPPPVVRLHTFHTTCSHTTCPHTTCSHNFFPHTTCPHAICSHTICSRTTWPHTTCHHTTCSLTHILSSHNLRLTICSPTCSHTTCPHTICSHTICSRTTYSHTTCSHTHYLSSHNLSSTFTLRGRRGTHNLLTHNLLTHNLLTHNLPTHNLSSHNLSSTFTLHFFPSNARWLSPGRLSSRKDNCIFQIHRIRSVATSVL